MSSRENTESNPPDRLCLSRRNMMAALSGLVVLPGVVAACSAGSSEEGTRDRSAGSAAPGTPGSREVPVSMVPVGTARVVNMGGKNVVLAQPKAGEFVAFSAICTHAGALVQATGGLTLDCPAHGSEFNAANGDVERGPATKPLPSVKIERRGANLVLA